MPLVSLGTRTNATVSGSNINNLNNAQSAYSLVAGDTLAIPITATGYIGIGNIVNTSSTPIVIVVNGLVTPFQFEVGSPFIGVKVYCKLSDSSAGLVITNSGRGFVSNGSKVKNCSFFGIAIPNATDYPVFWYHSRTFAGNWDSINTNIIFDSIRVTGGAALIDGFNFNNNGTSYLRGLWDSVTFRNCYINNMLGGNSFSVQHFFHGYWYKCTFTNIGLTDTRHCGNILMGDGQCVVELCYFYNTYGNKVRWQSGTSLVLNKNQPFDTCKFINNKVVLSRKYPGVECNSNAATFDTSSQWIRAVNYIIANNNMGRFNDSDYVDSGVPLDIYVHYGFIWLNNLIAWDSHMDKAPGANPYYHIGDGSNPPDDTTGCRYGSAAQILSLYLQDTVQAVTKINSIGNGVGRKLPTIVIQSWNGQNRPFAIQYDIGSYQFSGRSIFTYRRDFLKTKSANAEPDDFTKKLRIEVAIWKYLLNLQYGEDTVIDSMPKRLGF